MIQPVKTRFIIWAMILGSSTGITIHHFGIHLNFFNEAVIVGSDLFMRLIKMLVVPVVFVSLMTGVGSLKNIGTLGRIGSRTLFYYLLTTALAISIALLIAYITKIGTYLHMVFDGNLVYESIQSPSQVITQIIPINPFKALVEGHMLQIIFFAIIFATAINKTDKHREKLMDSCQRVNDVLMNLVMICMKTAPIGVFFLLTKAFCQVGFGAMYNMMAYMIVVACVLLIQLIVTYGLFIKVIAKLSPLVFFKKMTDCMLFAFSVSSSNASIPLVLKTIKEKLGISNSIGSFVIPMGATINMDGTAIMQGVATVFIANAYSVDIGIYGYLIVIAMATLASIGTAGVPGVGLIMLTMVLQQLGLPVDGPVLAMIFGVDRLIDMCRTAVNVCGDAMVATCIAHHENQLNRGLWTTDQTSDAAKAETP